MDGYFQQPASISSLVKLAASFQGNGLDFVPIALFPSLFAGLPSEKWGHMGLKTSEFQTAVHSVIGGDRITIGWDGADSFIIIATTGAHISIKVYQTNEL